jgi:non-homologous end joining protein Ku
LARFPAPFSSVLPDLFVARDDTHETHSFAESSKVVDLEKFVAGSDIDPVYFDSPYTLAMPI